MRSEYTLTISLSAHRDACEDARNFTLTASLERDKKDVLHYATDAIHLPMREVVYMVPEELASHLEPLRDLLVLEAGLDKALEDVKTRLLEDMKGGLR